MILARLAQCLAQDYAENNQKISPASHNRICTQIQTRVITSESADWLCGQAVWLHTVFRTRAYPTLPPVLGSSAVQVLTSVPHDTPGFFHSSLLPWIQSPRVPSVCYLHTVQPTMKLTALFLKWFRLMLLSSMSLVKGLKRCTVQSFLKLLASLILSTSFRIS